MVNTRKLKAVLVERGVTQAEAAKIAKLSPVAFFNKLHNKSEFNASEIMLLADGLGIKNKDEIFFASNVE